MISYTLILCGCMSLNAITLQEFGGKKAAAGDLVVTVLTKCS